MTPELMGDFVVHPCRYRIKQAPTPPQPVRYWWSSVVQFQGFLARDPEKAVLADIGTGVVLATAHYRDVRFVDINGHLFVIDEILGPWGVTSCCGASSKGLEDGVGCRSCYRLLDDDDDFRDGPPVLDPEIRHRVAGAYLRRVVADLAVETEAAVQRRAQFAGETYDRLLRGR